MRSLLFALLALVASMILGALLFLSGEPSRFLILPGFAVQQATSIKRQPPTPVQRDPGGLSAETAVPGRGPRLIIELTEAPLAKVVDSKGFWGMLRIAAQRQRIAAQQNAVIARLIAPDIGAIILSRTDLIINSLTIEVSANKVPLIRQIPGVKAIYPALTVNPADPGKRNLPIETPSKADTQ